MTSPAIHCAHSELWPLEKFIEHPRNPNKHGAAQLQLLAKVIVQSGWRRPVTVSRRSGFVIVGHGRLQAARMAGLTEAPVDLQDYANEAEEWADMVADNRLAELAEMNLPDLNGILKELEAAGADIELAGFTADALAEMRLELAPESAVTDEAAPALNRGEELAAKWHTARGQLWGLGRHRLLCGDAMSAQDVAKVMAGQRAALCLTDPPWGVGLEYQDTADTPEHLRKLVEEFLPIAQSVSEVMLITPGLTNLWIYPPCTWPLSWHYAAGQFRSPWGFSCWQPILAYGKDPYLQHGLGSRPDSVDGSEPAENELGHPCPKPLKIWKWILERGSINKGDVIFDPFMGSGSTIIAAEQLERVARGLEISPAYVAIILQRWQDSTGQAPVLIDG